MDAEAVEVVPGEQFELVLTGHGVGGYEWQLADAGSLQLLSTDVEAGGELPGAAGSARFAFTAATDGSTAPVFELRRRWEERPLRSHHVAVTVRTLPDQPGG